MWSVSHFPDNELVTAFDARQLVGEVLRRGSEKLSSSEWLQLKNLAERLENLSDRKYIEKDWDGSTKRLYVKVRLILSRLDREKDMPSLRQSTQGEREQKEQGGILLLL